MVSKERVYLLGRIMGVTYQRLEQNKCDKIVGYDEFIMFYVAVFKSMM